MALCCTRMLASKQLHLSSSLLRSLQTAPKTLVAMKVLPYKPPAQEDHDTRNARLKRPMSPHLTIYSPQLTSMLSITHRITGLALTGAAYGLGIGSLMLPESLPAYVAFSNLSPEILLAGKLCLAFPFAYHTCNGVRHLVWDMGQALTIKEVYTTGYIMLGVSAVITALLVTL